MLDCQGARILGGTRILSEASGGFITVFAQCPFCSACVVGLLHFTSVSYATQDLRPNPLGMQPMNFLVKSLFHARTEGETINRIARIGSAWSPGLQLR